MGTFLIATFFAFSAWAGPVLDHCPSCRIEVKPQSSATPRLCPNLMGIDESSKTNMSFLRKFEGLLFRKVTRASFNKLRDDEKVDLFTTTLEKATENFTPEISSETIRERLLARVGCGAEEKCHGKPKSEVLKDLSSGLTVEEIIADKTLPSEEAKARLYFSLAKKYSVPAEAPQNICIVSRGDYYEE